MTKTIVTQAAILPQAGVVTVNGRTVGGLDLSFIDQNILDIEWYGHAGTVQYQVINNARVSNTLITDITPYQHAIDLALATIAAGG